MGSIPRRGMADRVTESRREVYREGGPRAPSSEPKRSGELGGGVKLMSYVKKQYAHFVTIESIAYCEQPVTAALIKLQKQIGYTLYHK